MFADEIFPFGVYGLRHMRPMLNWLEGRIRGERDRQVGTYDAVSVERPGSRGNSGPLATWVDRQASNVPRRVVFGQGDLLYNLRGCGHPSGPIRVEVQDCLTTLDSFGVGVGDRFNVEHVVVSTLTVSKRTHQCLDGPVVRHHSLTSTGPGVSFEYNRSKGLSTGHLTMSALFLALIRCRSSFRRAPTEGPISLPPYQQCLAGKIVMGLRFPDSLRPGIGRGSYTISSKGKVVSFTTLTSGVETVPVPWRALTTYAMVSSPRRRFASNRLK